MEKIISTCILALTYSLRPNHWIKIDLSANGARATGRGSCPGDREGTSGDNGGC